MGAKHTVQAKKDGKTREPFVMVPFRWMDLPAWKHLSGSAVKMLLQLIRLSGGDNGYRNEHGGLFLSERKAAADLRMARNTASAALDLLDEIGWIRPVGPKGHFNIKAGENGQRATYWRLTFQPHPQSKRGPTMEFRDWEPQEKSRAQKLNGAGAEIEPPAEIEREAGSKIEPVAVGSLSDGENSDRSIIEPYLESAIGKRSFADPQNSERPANERNGVPPQEAIRQRVEQHLSTLDDRGRSRLAAGAGLSPVELRQFVAGRLFVQPGKLAALRSLVTPKTQPERQVA